jgi:hypothetical protein
MKKSLKTILGLSALAGTIVVTYALTTFDPSTGIGFVGKGDVQTPWSWNDQTLQAQAENVTFAYNSAQQDIYAVTCEFDTGSGTHVVHHTINKASHVGDTVAYDVTKANRNNPQGKVTGFNLTGQENVDGNEVGSVPAVGDPCPGASEQGLVTAVELSQSNFSEELTASDTVLGTGPTVIWSNGVSVHL